MSWKAIEIPALKLGTQVDPKGLDSNSHASVSLVLLANAWFGNYCSSIGENILDVFPVVLHKPPAIKASPDSSSTVKLVTWVKHQSTDDLSPLWLSLNLWKEDKSSFGVVVEARPSGRVSIPRQTDAAL